MSYARRITVTVTTDGSQAADVMSDVCNGRLSQIRYVKSDFTNGVDFAITLARTGETIWQQNDVNASATIAPRQPTHGTDGAASLYASGGAAVQAPILVADDRFRIVIANGGAAKVGTFHFILE